MVNLWENVCCVEMLIYWVLSHAKYTGKNDGGAFRDTMWEEEKLNVKCYIVFMANN